MDPACREEVKYGADYVRQEIDPGIQREALKHPVRIEVKESGTRAARRNHAPP
jgi:hypothetical protein